MRRFARRHPTLTLLAYVTSVACTGGVGGPEDPASMAAPSAAPIPSGPATMPPGNATGQPGMPMPGAPVPPAGTPPSDPGAPRTSAGGTQRLTPLEYVNTLRMLLPTAKLPATSLVTASSGFSSISAGEEAMGPSEVNELFDIAATVAKQVAADPKARQALVGCVPTGPADGACARQFVTGFGRNVWRRPLVDAEIQRLTRLLTGAATEMNDFWTGVELTLTAFLQSPHFLYRFELGRPDGRLTGYELATRLAFMLTSSTPLPAVLDAAARGELEPDAPGLRAKVAAMLDEPKTKDGFARFFREWLHLDELAVLNRDGDMVVPSATDPNAKQKIFTTALVADLQSQTLRELSSAVFDENRDFTELMTSRQILVNGRLAPLYGVAPPSPDAKVFARTALPEAHQRAGLLGHVSFLTLHAASKASSPVHRGVAVLGSFLCRPIPPPPPDVTAPAASAQPMTARQQLARHRADAGCAACHNLIDPPGLAFEHFDHLGRRRENDRGLAIDASGSLDGKPFTDAASFAELIKVNADFHACMVRQLYQYARGNFDEARAKPRLAALTAKFQRDGFRLKSLVVDLVTDPLFLTAGGAP